MHPRTSHVVLAGTERCLVKPPRFECRNNWVLRRFWGQNIVSLIANALRGTASWHRDLRGFLRPPGWGKFQLQPIHNLLWRVAFVRPPFDQATLKWCAGFVGIFWLAVDCRRQPCPAAQWPSRSRIAETRVDHRIEQAHGSRAIGERLVQDDAALIISRTRLDQP